MTTPESLTLFLARADWRERFAHLAAIVVDEWHELMGTKRGVQTELALAGLRGSRALLTRPSRPTPFAFPLLVEMFREEISAEALDAPVARMVDALERDAGAA